MSRGRAALAVILTLLLVAAGSLTAIPADAATASAGTLQWGFKQSFRNYVSNTNIGGDGAITATGNASQPGGGANPFEWAAGTGDVDVDAGTANVSWTGGITFLKHHGELDITLANPQVVLSDAERTLYVSVTTAAGTQRVAFATLGAGTPAVSGTTATWANVPATLTAAGAEAFKAYNTGEYDAGDPVDPVTFSATVQAAPAATTTALAVSPQTGARVGDPVVLTATVTPASGGSVEFFDGAVSLGTAPVVDGAASVTVTTLGEGMHSLSAAFVSDDSGVAGSTSSVVTYEVAAAPVEPAVETSTTLAVSPATRAIQGGTVELSATVEPAVANGTVEFFATKAGSTDAVSLGVAPVQTGVAAIETTDLAAGGYAFQARFTPASGAFEASESAKTANYGVVDVSVPVAYVPGAAAVESSGASASWAFSQYSYAGYMKWAKTADGEDITVVGNDYVFSNGVVRADSGGATVSFDGWFTLEPHAGHWITFTDPVLSVTADGSGVWSADVTTSANATAKRLVFATFSGADVAGAGSSVDTEIELAYEGATALGTWNAGYGNAWPNAFVLEVPSALQAYFYQSGTSAANLQKPPSPLTLAFDWPVITATETAVSVSPSTRVVKGDELTITATVTTGGAIAPTGSVEFFAKAAGTDAWASLGTAELLDGVAVRVDRTLAAGGYTFKAVYTSNNGYASSEAATTANYGVVDVSVPAACTLSPNAQTSSGASASWAFSQYSYAGYMKWAKTADGEDITVDGSDYVFTNGTVRADANCATVSFDGWFTLEPHAGHWITFTDPVLSVTADGSGVWSADVTTSANATAKRLVFATFSGADVAGAGSSVDTEIELAYEGATALGTWNAGYGNAWPNAFVLEVPSALQAYFYQSGTSAANLQKPPSPLTLAFDWPVVPVIDGGGQTPSTGGAGQTVAAGSLVWGIKSQFITYITGQIAKGSLSLSGGATYANGVFQFGQAVGSTYDAATGLGSVGYNGSVRFWGHAGELDFAVSNPQIRVTSATTAQLWASGVHIGVVDLAGAAKTAANGAVTYRNAGVTLTAEGRAMFRNFYTTLDPLTFTIGAASAAPSGSTGTVATAAAPTPARTFPATPPATTGIQVDEPVLEDLQAGRQVTISVGGFQPFEQDIAIVVYSTPVLLGTVDADARGIATWTGVLPATLEDGVHTLTFQGSVSRGIQFTLAREAALASAGQCTVEGAELKWGYKESFRSYIEGIAHGGWELTDIVYEYPDYVWSNGAGSIDVESATGLVTFGGTLAFHGHDGALNTTFSNARLELAGDTGYLVFDITGTTQGGESVDQKDVRLAEFDLGAPNPVDGVITIEADASTLTEAGSAAFGTYAAGEALDPITVTLPVADDCAVAVVEADEEAETVVTTAADEETADAGLPIWVWIVGILVLIAIAILVTVLVVRRRNAGTDED
ncbi:HtaA domain-containing protein [Microbacterium sp. GXF7504]